MKLFARKDSAPPASYGRTLAALSVSFFLAVAIFAFLLAVLCNSLSPGFGTTIASGIPFVRNFIVRTWPTFLYAQSRSAEARLSLGRMDIDFLISIQGPEGLYIELCPYTVEGFLEMGTIVDEQPSRSFSIEYACSYRYGGGGIAPSPAQGGESRAWRLAEDFAPDWNTVLVPFHQAFRERAYDIALSDASFDAECRKSASERIAGVFGDFSDNPFDSTSAPGPAARIVSAGFLPVAFRTAERSYAHRNAQRFSAAAADASHPSEDPRTVPAYHLSAIRSRPAGFSVPVSARPAAALRDDCELSSSLFDAEGTRFYRLTPAGRTAVRKTPSSQSASANQATANQAVANRAGMKSISFDRPDGRAEAERQSADELRRSFASRNAGTNLVFRYHDPVDPRRLSCFGFADSGFGTVFAALRGIPEILCVQSISPEADPGNSALATPAPDGSALYLAFSLETASFSLETALPEDAAIDGIHREAENASRAEARSQWDAYRGDYEIALEELRAGRRGRRFELSRRGMLKSASRISELTGMGPWTDVSLFETPGADSAVSVMFAQEAGILAALLEGDPSAFSLVFGSDGDRALSVRQGDEAAGQLAAFFWSIRKELSLDETESDGLLEDLLGSGAAVNKALLTELDSV